MSKTKKNSNFGSIIGSILLIVIGVILAEVASPGFFSEPMNRINQALSSTANGLALLALVLPLLAISIIIVVKLFKHFFK